VHTVEGALARISQPQPFQVSHRSDLSEASLQTFHEALLPILNLHLKCLLCDATADIVKINKLIQFAPDIYSAACFVLKDVRSRGQGKCIRRSGYPSHQSGLYCYVVGELSDFTFRLVKQQRRPCDCIRLHGFLSNGVIGHF
jgi:hypothetical protein